MHIVYLITCTANGKRYVGITGRSLHERWSRHISDARSANKQVFHRAIRKYGEAAFSAEKVAEYPTRLEANLEEQRLIALYRTTDTEYGYNVDAGGTAHGMSDETRRKIGERVRSYHANATAEERAKIKSRAAKARAARTSETNEKISASLKEWFAADTAEARAELELRRHSHRAADAEANYGQARAYKPKPPRTPEQRRESDAKAAPFKSATLRRTLAAKPAEVKRDEKLRMWETRRAALEAMTPEQREAKRLARKRPPAKTPDEHAAILAKSWETRRARAAAGVPASESAASRAAARRANIAAACPAPSLRFNLLAPRIQPAAVAPAVPAVLPAPPVLPEPSRPLVQLPLFAA